MNIFHPIQAFFARLRAGRHLDPARDWLFLLGAAIAAFAVIVVWNSWAFSSMEEVASGSTRTNENTSAFNGSSLDAIQTIFSARSAEEAKYTSGGYGYTDPSQ